MSIDRRRLIALSALTGAVPAATLATPVAAAPLTTLGIDATTLGVRAGGGAEQTEMLQNAIDRTAGARVPLVLGPGEYRTRTLKLPAGAQIMGIRGATRLKLTGGSALVFARGADHVTLSGLMFDGTRASLPEDGALLHVEQSGGLRVMDCEFVSSAANGIRLEQIEGVIAGNTITGAAESGIFSRDARGLVIQNNVVRGSGNNGILVWRNAKGDDGTLVLDNRIEDIANRRGGSGQYGNAINVFRAGNVTVRGNRIARVAFTAVRGNAASNIQIANNTATDCGEVALYAEFGFEGAVIVNNAVDGAAIGISVTNFNEGGRLAVVQGNLIRNLRSQRPAGTDPNDGSGIGIAVEADTSVTGNVIENAPIAGISVGWGRHMRDVTVVGNVVRSAGYGVSVSVATGAGVALISGNLIADAKRGAIVGMHFAQAVTGDLSKEPSRFAQIQIGDNRVR